MTDTPQPPTFTGTPGMVVNMEDKDPVDYFHLFFDERVLDLIHKETVRYTDQYLERESEFLEEHPKARAHEWRRYPLTLKDVDVFLAIIIAMGICGFPTLRYTPVEMQHKYSPIDQRLESYTHMYLHVHVKIMCTPTIFMHIHICTRRTVSVYKRLSSRRMHIVSWVNYIYKRRGYRYAHTLNLHFAGHTGVQVGRSHQTISVPSCPAAGLN